MGIIKNKHLEEKALENFNRDCCCLDSLEYQVSGYFDDLYHHQPYNNNRTVDDCDDESDNDDLNHPSERNLFWETQEALLEEILERYNITVQKLREEVTRIIEMARETESCSCSKPCSNGCMHCLRRIVVQLLTQKGFNASLRTSKWKHTSKLPGGSHEYIEVMANTSGRKKQVPFVIELEFRDQFKMAKACEEYHQLVNQLPEFYIGKLDCLNAIVRVLCNAAKRSMTEKKIHMGPWRKRGFMEMKWSSSSSSNSVEKKTQNQPHDQPLNKFSFKISLRQSHQSCFNVPAVQAVAVS